MRTIVQSSVDAYLIIKTLFEEHAKYNDIIQYDEKSILKVLKNQLTDPITLNELFDDLVADGLIQINPSQFPNQPQLITISIKGANAYQKFKNDSFYISKINKLKDLFNTKDSEALLFEDIDHLHDDLKIKVIRAELCNYFFGDYLIGNKSNTMK